MTTFQRSIGSFSRLLRAVLWTAGLCYLAGLASRSGAPPPAVPVLQAPPAPDPASVLAGHVLGGRLWTHVDQPTRGRLKFRMYQFNPAGNDGKGTGWYHEGDFTEWLTETLRYEIRGDELVLNFDLARETCRVRFKVERAKGPNGADLKFTLQPDPRRYFKPYEYWANSREKAAALPDGEILF